MTIAENFANVRKRIQDCERIYHRHPGSVSLLAASKGQGIEKIKTAINCGQFAFGENYLQEAIKKITTLANPKLIWHFIGTIQNNKTQKIAEHFAWVHSVDNKKIAQRLNDHRSTNLPPLQICIEVKTDKTNAKSGVTFDEIIPLINYCRTLPRLNVRGLMTIPPPQLNFESQLKIFHSLYLYLEELKAQGFALDTLSMGMSDDFEAAIAAGATFIRLGTALFGPRISRKINPLN